MVLILPSFLFILERFPVTIPGSENIFWITSKVIVIIVLGGIAGVGVSCLLIKCIKKLRQDEGLELMTA